MSEHEWVIGILHSNINIHCLTHHAEDCKMSVEEAEAMLNEHAALKRRLAVLEGEPERHAKRLIEEHRSRR